MKKLNEIPKTCGMCGIEFFSQYHRQNICSFSCKQASARQRAKIHMKISRERKAGIHIPCEVCGFDQTIDIHHESDRLYYLCPNHHSLITRGIKNISQLMGTQ